MHHLIVVFFAGALVLSSLAVLTVSPGTAQAACPTGSSVIITAPSSTANTTPLSGITTLQAYSTPIAASGVSFMLYPTQQTIGEATQNGSLWKLDWDTRNQPNGTYQLMAIAHFGSTTSLDCASPVAPLAINNLATQIPSLKTTVTPNTWQGPVGASAAFSLDVQFTDQYGRQSHVVPTTVVWSTPLGSVSPPGASSVVFMAGAVGTGPLWPMRPIRG